MLPRKLLGINENGFSLQYFHRSFTRPLSLKSPFLSASKEASQETRDETLEKHNQPSESHPTNQSNTHKTKPKTVSQSDAELRERLEQMSGEGGAAGIEYEDGKPVAMKRSVRKNMFRLI